MLLAICFLAVVLCIAASALLLWNKFYVAAVVWTFAAISMANLTCHIK